MMQCNKLGPAAVGTEFLHAAVRGTIHHPVCRKSQQMQRTRNAMGDVAEVPAVGRPNLVLSVVRVSPPMLHNLWLSFFLLELPILL